MTARGAAEGAAAVVGPRLHHRPAAAQVLSFEQTALKASGLDYPPVPPRYHSPYFSHIFSPEDNDYSAGYYAYLWSEVLARDTGQWFHAHGGLTRAIKKFNTNDYWELGRHEAGIPWETTLYVPKILATAIMMANKRAFGPWMRHVFTLLAWLRPLRGTALDIFGYMQERRMERRLIAEYETVLRELATSLTPDNHALAVEIAALPAQIRGFGHIKAKNVETAKACEVELLALWRSKDSSASAA